MDEWTDDGALGDPRLASIEFGETVVEIAYRKMIEFTRAFAERRLRCSRRRADAHRRPRHWIRAGRWRCPFGRGPLPRQRGDHRERWAGHPSRCGSGGGGGPAGTAPAGSARPIQRASMCHRVAELLEQRKEEIARDLSLEQGKPYRLEALPEVETAAEMFRDAAEGIKRLETGVIPSSDPAKRVITIRQPRGVYGILTPWNFPVAIPSEYLSGGLAAGNAMVWKPSEWTPVSAQHIVQCFLDADVPKGTLNLILGDPSELGDELAGHPGIVAIGLTGSSRTGQVVARRAAGKAMLLELGGNGPTIIFGDADLDRAVARTAFGCFANAGQICDSTERILVHESVHDR